MLLNFPKTSTLQEGGSYFCFFVDPFAPKISLVILLNVCHTILMMLYSSENLVWVFEEIAENSFELVIC